MRLMDFVDGSDHILSFLLLKNKLCVSGTFGVAGVKYLRSSFGVSKVHWAVEAHRKDCG